MAELTETQRILLMTHRDAHTAMTTAQIVGEEVRRFYGGEMYRIMADAEQYYRNRSDIQHKTNDIAKRSNTKIEHPVLKKLIDQKINYTLSRPFSINSANPAYSDALNNLFDDVVRQKIKRFGRGAPKMGIGWMIPYISATGQFSFMVVPATRIIPFWEDEERTLLQGFLYIYPVTIYKGTVPATITKAELWDASGVEYFVGNTSGQFERDPDRPQKAAHFMLNGLPYNWKTPPLIWCKYNDEELPLQYYLKDLIDDINWQTSVTSDVLRDVAKFIWVLQNYAGEDLAEFVDALRKHLAINVESDGGVDVIQPDPKVESVLNFIDKQRRDAIDMGAGVDTKDPELGSASGKAIYFRYMDLDTDSTNLQNELKAAFQRLKPFVDSYFQILGLGDFSRDTFDVVFNTDMPVDETEIFQNAQAAKNIGLSLRTILSNIPWVKDVEEEMVRIATEEAEALRKQDEEIRRMSALNFPEPPPEGDEE